MNVPSLSWTHRPPRVKEAIDDTFLPLSQGVAGHWNYNGKPAYRLCHINEHQWLIELIKKEGANRKSFYVLDVGAGDFSWAVGCANAINADPKILNDIIVYIFSVRGESNPTHQDEHRRMGKCEIFNLVKFKVEELFWEFKTNRKFDLENKVDLIVSSWCFRHLVDPLGTWEQLLKLLRENTGLLTMDGFFFLFKDQTMDDDRDSNVNMIHLLKDTKNIRFIMNSFSGGRSQNHFALKKSSNDTQVPYSYCQGLSKASHWQIFSECVTMFNREVEPGSKVINFPRNDDKYYGDKALFDELKQNHLGKLAKYFPIEREGKLSIHEAVQSNNAPLLLECCANDMDLDFCNSEGKTPICLSIELRSKEIFDLLLENGASSIFWNAQGEAPIHSAAKWDHEGYFLKRLIENRADIYKLTRPDQKNALDLAIDAQNVTAVGCLLEEGAVPSEENEKALEASLFASVYTPPDPEEKRRPSPLGQVVNFIKDGDCVLLWGNGKGIMYNTEDLSPTQGLHVVIADPFESILGEWPDFIALAGYQGVPYDKAAFVNFKPAHSHLWSFSL
jgi:ankyrin repeat protein